MKKSVIVFVILYASQVYGQSIDNNYFKTISNYIQGHSVCSGLDYKDVDSYSEMAEYVRCASSLGKFSKFDTLYKSLDHFTFADRQNIELLLGELAYMGMLSGSFNNSDSIYSLLKIGQNHSIHDIPVPHILYLLEWGQLKIKQGEYPKAEELLIKAVEILQPQKTKQVELWALAHELFGLLRLEQSSFEESQQYLSKAFQIWDSTSHTHHPWIYSLTNHQSIVYRSTGKYDLAEETLIELLDKMQGTVQNVDVIKADVLSNFGSLHRLMHNYENALSFFKKSQQIYKTLGMEAEYAIASSNTGLAYDNLDSIELALQHYDMAIELYQTRIGTKNLNYATVINNKAGLLDYNENYEEAEKLYLESIKIIKSILGAESDYYVTMLSNLGILYENMDMPEKSEPYYLEALAIRKKILGVKHPKYAELLYNLAGVLSSTEPSRAIEIYQEANYLQLELMRYYYSRFDEATRLHYLKEMEIEFERFYSLVTSYNTDQRVNEHIQNFSLGIKGLALEYHIGYEADHNIENKEYKNLYDDWSTLKDSIAYCITLKKSDLDEKGISLENLIQEAEASERKLARYNTKLLTPITIDHIQNKIKDNQVTVDFIKFEKWDEGFWADTILYYALITKQDKSLSELVKITSEKNLLNIVKDLRNPVSCKKSLSDLYDLVWRPLEPYISSNQEVFISPTGVLHQIPFDALYSGEGYLGQELELHTFNVLRDVLKQTSESNRFESMFLLGDVNFNSPEQETEGAYAQAQYFSELPGSLREVESIEMEVREKGLSVQSLQGGKASEREVKSNLSDRDFDILHFSTHGYFFNQVDAPDHSELSLRNKIITNSNPLMRSGLVLSGVNQYWSSSLQSDIKEDGVLSALEISNLNIKSNLAVLSACETALGDNYNGEGVFGLQRAFKMAGVNKLIMSLWKVPDNETAELMISFYENLLKHNDIHKAFQTAQLSMSKLYDPFYWAGFVLVE